MLEAKYRATVEDLYATDEYRAKSMAGHRGMPRLYPVVQQAYFHSF